MKIRPILWFLTGCVLTFTAVVTAVYKGVDMLIGRAFDGKVPSDPEKIVFTPGLDLDYELYRDGRAVRFDGWEL